MYNDLRQGNSSWPSSTAKDHSSSLFMFLSFKTSSLGNEAAGESTVVPRNSESMVITESAFEISRDLSWFKRPTEGSLVHDMQLSRSKNTRLGKEVPSLGPFIQFGNFPPL